MVPDLSQHHGPILPNTRFSLRRDASFSRTDFPIRARRIPSRGCESSTTNASRSCARSSSSFSIRSTRALTSSTNGIRTSQRKKGTVLFHALGAWRISAAFHDLLWSSAVVVPAEQLLRGTRALLARSALREAASPRRRRVLAPGLLLLDPDRADGPPDVLDPLWMTSTKRMAVRSTSREAIDGGFCR